MVAAQNCAVKLIVAAASDRANTVCVPCHFGSYQACMLSLYLQMVKKFLSPFLHTDTLLVSTAFG